MSTRASVSITTSVLLLLSATAGAKTIDWSGDWALQFQTGSCAFNGTATVNQDGSAVSGNISVRLTTGPSFCPPSMSASMRGSVQGTDINMGAVVGGQLGTASFLGTASDPTTLGGTLSVVSGPFNGMSGTWGAVKACASSATTLCIDNQPGDQRFEVKIQFTTGGTTGNGNAIPLASLGVTHGGLFWFFGADNPEVLVKVLNACGVNSSFWVFSAAGTNVGFTMTVRDAMTGHAKTYMNPENHAAIPIQDTSALPCP
ncbi:MAG: hypothetical protein M3O15_11825 [Acidobacteriota bacterium]|nr:hypothetical protein [Acidobacteriota bacterium]